jgi:hypothetical protein
VFCADGTTKSSVPAVRALEAKQFTHEELVLEAQAPTADSHIAGLSPLLAAVPHLDLIDSLNDPVAHTLNHGIVDELLAIIFGNGATKNMKPWRVHNKHRPTIEARVLVVQSVEDISRPLKRLTEARGHWTYDDTAWFMTVYVPLIGLYQFIEAAWMNDMLYYCSRMLQHAWFLFHPGLTYQESLDDAQLSAELFAQTAEREKLYTLCTSNLHSLVCHMFKSEKRGGPVARRRDLGIERFIGQLKVGVVNKVTFMPEKTQARNYAIFQAVLSLEQYAVKNGVCLPPGALSEDNSQSFDHTGKIDLLNKVSYGGEDAAKLREPLGTLLGDERLGEVTFYSSCNYGGQILHFESKYTRDMRKRSSYFGLKNMKTFGIVAAFAETPNTFPIVLFHPLKWVKSEFHDQVHILEVVGAPLQAAFVSTILGRVAVIRINDEKPNELRAVFIPKFVNNNLN